MREVWQQWKIPIDDADWVYLLALDFGKLPTACLQATL